MKLYYLLPIVMPFIAYLVVEDVLTVSQYEFNKAVEQAGKECANGYDIVYDGTIYNKVLDVRCNVNGYTKSFVNNRY